MKQAVIINQDNIEKYICKFTDLSEKSKFAVSQFFDYWEGEDSLPFTSLFSKIGTSLAHDLFIFDNKVRYEIFAHIELGMNSDDEYLATAVATGLVEALVNASDNNPELWVTIESCLGNESKKHAIAWRNFGQ